MARTRLVTDDATRERMRGIRQRDTGPEVEVRKLLHQLGYRYRLANGDLPGSPDIVNRTRRWAIFVHGCFWHGHRRCALGTIPKRNRAFWLEKLAQNRDRDRRKAAALRRMGYVVVTVWQCEMARRDVASKIRQALACRYQRRES